MKTKLHLIIMSLVLLFVAGGQSVCLAAESWSYPTSKPKTPFGGGDGSWYDPYRIETAQHLANLAYMVTDENTEYKGKYFVLTNDITLNDDVINDEGTGLKNPESSYKLWTPIGEYGFWGDDEFKGYFDGQGHTIRGLVCINFDGEGKYNGFFGATDEATIKNLNLEDCYVCATTVDEHNQKYGVLAAETVSSTFINCHVSKSVVDVFLDYSPWMTNDKVHIYVGGLIASCDYSPGKVSNMHDTSRLTNCSFQGNIYVQVTGDELNYVHVGGLLGYHRDDNGTQIYLTNCYTEGDTYITGANDIYYLSVGGLSSNFTGGSSEIKGCVSRMNITVDTHDNEVSTCVLSGLGYTCPYRTYMVSDCVYLGTIKLGTESHKAEIEKLYLHGLMYRGYLNSCAFYGKFDIHCKGEEANIASMSDMLVENKASSVVCSVDNIIDIDYNKYTIDQVSNQSSYLKYGNLYDSKHKCYYHFSNSGNVTYPCKGTEDASKYNKTLEQMKADDFIRDLNTLAGSNVWGKLSGMSDDRLNGLPMPVACGGILSDYAGDGSLGNPYIINSETDLNRLKESVSNGSTFEGKYFKLGSDIRITGTLDESIGKDYEKPFKGHLDGCGHAIIGLRKSLFGYMYGTVKNLALVDCNIWVNGYATALARYVGNENNKAEVSNCYVSGIIASTTPWDQQGYASTFGFHVSKGSSIHDCYFRGRFVLKEQTFNTCNVAGIAIYDVNDVNTSADSPAGIFNCYASFDVKVESGWLTQYTCYGICNRPNDYSKDNYFVCSDYRLSSYYCGGTKLNSESELNGKFNGKSAWLQGVYRPLLASAKLYKATSPDGETAYFDAIPEANPKKNYFYNISIDDPYSDASLWNLPNMAVYVPSEQKDYITSGYIDQSSELKYKRSEGATGTLGQLHFSLTQNKKGAHFVCLPGEVLKSDLPEGSDATIVGRINCVNGKEQVNIVHLDTIPAGVPFFLYVPVTSVKSGDIIDMLMRSGIATDPVMDAEYSSFKGTFSPQIVSEQACLDVAKVTFTRAATRGAAQVEDAYYFIRGNEDAEVKPFSAWIESSLGNVRIVDYLLLDEYSQTNEELIDNSTDNVNIKLRLTMDADKWTTVCLPFDMGTDEIKEKFGEDTKLEEIESISYDGTTLYIKLKEATGGIVNGRPYFIKPSASNSIFDLGPRILSNELSEDVYMAISSDATRELSLKLGGAYGMSILSSAEDFNAYYFTDGTLIQVPFGTPFTLGGFRCWFKASDATTSAPAELTSVVITHSDGTLTDISVVAKDPQATKQTIYDLRGVEKKSGKGIAIKNGIKVTQLSEVNIPW